MPSLGGVVSESLQEALRSERVFCFPPTLLPNGSCEMTRPEIPELWVDDGFLFFNSIDGARKTLRTLADSLCVYGEQINVAKSKYATVNLPRGAGVLDFGVGQIAWANEINVLGNMVSVSESIAWVAGMPARNARELQRRAGAAWGKFHAHAEMFCEKGVAVRLRLRALRAVAGAALVWGMAAAGLTQLEIKSLATAWLYIVARVLRCPRFFGEPWQEWSVRRLRQARDVSDSTTRGPAAWIAEETCGLVEGLTRDEMGAPALRAVQWRCEAWWLEWPRSRWRTRPRRAASGRPHAFSTPLWKAWGARWAEPAFMAAVPEKRKIECLLEAMAPRRVRRRVGAAEGEATCVRGHLRAPS